MDACYISTSSRTVASLIIQYYKLKKVMSEHKGEMFEGDFQVKITHKKIINQKIIMIATPKDIYNVPTSIGYLFAKFPPNNSSYFLNIDLLSSSHQNNCKMPVLCNKIYDEISSQNYYTDILYEHDFIEDTIYCSICDNKNYDVHKGIPGDLTTAGVFKAASYFLTLDKIFILRVSENDVFSALEWFSNVITYDAVMRNTSDEAIDDKIKNTVALFETIISNLKFSENMKQQIIKIFTYRALTDFPICQRIINEYENKKSMSKQEAKEYFENIKSTLMDF